jgi:hypothetical protein
MTKQSTPHTQTQQNTQPEETDSEPNAEQQGISATDADLYSRMEGAETGGNRSPRHAATGSSRTTTEPETEAHEGSVDTRTPKRPAQGITSRSSEEESARQEKVVNERPDAQAGVNRSK